MTPSGFCKLEPDIEIVLMDIMMPEMDGLDTMRVIRKLPQFNALPIIAVTAKAMKGDREKCIEAGAWDYLSKPVDTEQLLSVLRVWLHRYCLTRFRDGCLSWRHPSAARRASPSRNQEPSILRRL